ncbi:MAG TPA: hypothetical protein VN739_06235, partial [Nitrososphaerales archaeon]|nr:hypothetical protein [Nitrososphaerales archaeon]
MTFKYLTLTLFLYGTHAWVSRLYISQLQNERGYFVNILSPDEREYCQVMSRKRTLEANIRKGMDL